MTGKVSFAGKVPATHEFALGKFSDPAYCAKNQNKSEDGKVRLLKGVQIVKGGGLQDAIVAVRDIEEEAWMKGYEGATVRAELCEWSEFTGVVVNKSRFIAESRDADPDNPKSEDGTFELKGLLAGKHKLIAWHPVAGQMEKEIDVKDGESVKADFEIQ